MKTADVKIGNIYFAKVSGAKVKVVVVQRIEPTGFNKITRFRVRRSDNGKVLDKSRTAAALTPPTAPDPITEKMVADSRAAHALGEAGQWADAAAAWDRVKKMSTEHGRSLIADRADQRAAAARAKIETAHADATPADPPVDPEAAK